MPISAGRDPGRSAAGPPHAKRHGDGWQATAELLARFKTYDLRRVADAYRRSWHAWFEVPAMVRAIVLDRLDDQRRP